MKSSFCSQQAHPHVPPYKILSPIYQVHLYCEHRNHRPQFRPETWDLTDFSGQKTCFLPYPIFRPQSKDPFCRKPAWIVILVYTLAAGRKQSKSSQTREDAPVKGINVFVLSVFGVWQTQRNLFVLLLLVLADFTPEPQGFSTFLEPFQWSLW